MMNATASTPAAMVNTRPPLPFRARLMSSCPLLLIPRPMRRHVPGAGWGSDVLAPSGGHHTEYKVTVIEVRLLPGGAHQAPAAPTEQGIDPGRQHLERLRAPVVLAGVGADEVVGPCVLPRPAPQRAQFLLLAGFRVGGAALQELPLQAGDALHGVLEPVGRLVGAHGEGP